MSKDIVLRHDAPLYARVTDNMGSGPLGTLIIGGFVSAIAAAIWILISWGSPTDVVTLGQWAWLSISLMIGGLVTFLDQANCKRYISATKTDLGKATSYYHLLNKDHQKMARPVLDKMVELSSNPACPRGEIRKRYDRIAELYSKEQAQKVKTVMTDDLDLVTLNAYLDDKTLNGGQ